MKIAFFGGDIRIPEAAYHAKQKGVSVSLCGFNKYEYCPRCFNIENNLKKALENADAVVLGVPASHDSNHIFAPYSKNEFTLKELFSLSPKIIFGGKLSGSFISDAKEAGIKTVDYLTIEEFTLKNALITAEGAIYTAISEIPHTINGCNCLVMGYGRIGKFLSELLKKMGANVSCSARKDSDFALMECNGITPLHTYDLKKSIGKYDLIFNTIPVCVLSKDILLDIRENTLIVDLASKPGGVDYESAKELGLKVVWATALPGKLYPETSGKIITDTVLNILKKEVILYD